MMKITMEEFLLDYFSSLCNMKLLDIAKKKYIHRSNHEKKIEKMNRKNKKIAVLWLKSFSMFIAHTIYIY